MATLDNLLTAAEVAHRADCDISTVARAAQDGKLKTAFKAPGKTGQRFFLPRDVDKWMASREDAA